MATLLEPPATAALDTTFELDIPSVPSPVPATRYIKERPRQCDYRFVRAASEPINVTYHPELYDKLNSLWQQANTLISSQRSQQRPEVRSLPSEEMNTQTPISGQIHPTSSITDSEIFKLVYNSQANLNHFGITKQELPFVETVHNRQFISWIAAKEPGMKINYDEVRNNLARLSKEQMLRQNSPNVFGFFQSLLRAHDMYVLRGARFLSYDLWMNMIHSYYGSPGDVGLLSRFPVTEPTAFQDYIETSAKAMSEDALSNRKRNWTETHDQWEEAETNIINIKSSKEFYRRYDQLQKLMKIFRNRFEERAKRNRALRTIQANRKVDRKRIIKAANIHAWREQIGQDVPQDLDEQQLELLQHQIAEQSHEYNEKHDHDDSVTLPGQLQGMNLS